MGCGKREGVCEGRSVGVGGGVGMGGLGWFLTLLSPVLVGVVCGKVCV